MNANNQKQPSGCATVLKGGCLALVVLAALGGVLLFMNLDRIKSSELYQKAMQAAEKGKETLRDMMAVQAEVAREYPAGEVSSNVNMGSGGPSSQTLTIEIVNPQFSLSEGESWESKAREIAIFVKDHYESIEDVGTIEIKASKKSGVGVSFKSYQSFSFTKAELEDGG